MSSRLLLVLLVLAAPTFAALAGCAPEGNAPIRYDTAEEELRRCAAGSTLSGIDVSHHQGVIDWTAVGRTDTRFAFVRVSDGTYADRRFAENWAGARRAGITRGAYQFFRPTQDVDAQVDYFLRTVGTLEADDLPPVLDVEPSPGNADAGLSVATLRARVRRWIDRVAAATGRTPIIYTTDSYWTGRVGNADPMGSPLWVANFGASCPRTPTAWSSWTFFQYTETGRVAGITGNVDRNYFNGDEDALLALTEASSELPYDPTGGVVVTTWTRNDDGSYEMSSEAPPSVDRIEIFLDGTRLGAPVRTGGGFSFRTNPIRTEAYDRVLESRGYDASGRLAAVGRASIDTTADVAAYVRLVHAGTYEIGLERAPASVAGLEARADDYLLTDQVTGQQRSPRGAVRSRLTITGPRSIELRIFDATGAQLGEATRSIVVP
jgi:lysozyme